MNTINVNVRIKDKPEKMNLVLFLKIYSTPYGMVTHWSTDMRSEYRLEIIIDEDDLTVNPMKVTKAMRILTSEVEIADQVMNVLYETKSLYKAQFLM